VSNEATPWHRPAPPILRYGLGCGLRCRTVASNHCERCWDSPHRSRPAPPFRRPLPLRSSL